MTSSYVTGNFIDLPVFRRVDRTLRMSAGLNAGGQKPPPEYASVKFLRKFRT